MRRIQLEVLCVILLLPFALHPAIGAPDSFLASRPLCIKSSVLFFGSFVADMFRVSLVVLVPIETPPVSLRVVFVVQPTDW